MKSIDRPLQLTVHAAFFGTSSPRGGSDTVAQKYDIQIMQQLPKLAICPAFAEARGDRHPLSERLETPRTAQRAFPSDTDKRGERVAFDTLSCRRSSAERQILNGLALPVYLSSSFRPHRHCGSPPLAVPPSTVCDSRLVPSRSNSRIANLQGRRSFLLQQDDCQDG